MTSVQRAWESLSNTLRLYAESSLRFKSLLEIDPEEAISNHDRAFDAKLEAFHRLYDVTKSNPVFAYYAHGDTSLLIVLRNALHHHDHPLFMSWNKMMSNVDVNRMAGSGFLLASYEDRDESVASRYFFPLHDFYERLAHPSVKRSDTIRLMWDNELSFAAIGDLGRQERYPTDHVYVDVIPIFVSAMRRVTLWLQAAGAEPVGFDGGTYFEHFVAMSPVNLSSPCFRAIRLPAKPPASRFD